MLFPREIHDPIPCNIARATIETFAESVAKRLDFRQTRDETSLNAADDMIKLITRLDGRVMDAPNIKGDEVRNTGDSLIIFDEKNFTVFPSHNPLMDERLERSQAMFLGHELGHRFLHYPMVRSANPDRNDQPLVMVAQRYPAEDDKVQRQCDIEAFWFAHVLLFPEVLFRELWERHHGNAHKIASASRVLPTTVQNRAKRLGLIALEQAQAA